ncbi:unnamed protein product (mitochondrion) [Plasmodiophora brassicae]|uniref:Uncharacterized protein n=1 Tax=Plasmodiophora brassicae TaxID=37360 RepID=A0A3P3Y2J0_PLABS|nr:unnamed protein product [Plasmodiophora brassicae]
MATPPTPRVVDAVVRRGSVSGVPTPRSARQRARDQRARLLEFIRFAVFAVVFGAAVYGRANPSSTFDWTSFLRDRFAGSAALSAASLDRVSSVEQFWAYLNRTFVPSLVPDVLAGRPIGYEGSYLLGVVRLRQMRVAPVPCSPTNNMLDAMAVCFPSAFSSATMHTLPFGGPSGAMFEWGSNDDPPINAWLIAPNPDYEHGAYAVDLVGALAADQATVRRLRDNGFVDVFTRAILVEFAVYNVAVDRLCAVRIEFQMPAVGGVTPRMALRVVNAFPYATTPGIVVGIAEGLFLIAYANMFVSIVYRARHLRGRFLSSVSDLVDAANMVLFAVLIALRAVVIVASARLLALTAPAAYTNWQNLAYTHTVVVNVASCCVLFTCLHVLKYLSRLSDSLRSVKRVFAESSANLFAFLLVFIIVFFGFVQAFFMAFQGDIVAFRSIWQTFLTLFGSLSPRERFDYDSVVQSNYLLGPALVFCFVILIDLLLGHVFLAIVHSSYTQQHLLQKDLDFQKTVLDTLNGGGSPAAMRRLTLAQRVRRMLDLLMRPASVSQVDRAPAPPAAAAPTAAPS